MDELTDAQLVHRTLVLQDRGAYGVLVRRHQAAVRGLLRRLTGRAETADDLAQECFLRGFRQLGSLVDAAKFKAWIHAIARTEFLQWRRKAGGEEPVSDIEAPGQWPSFDVRLDVEKLLAGLRREERGAIILCLGYEFSHGEAALAMNLPAGTVKSLILRARAKIRKEGGR